MRSVFKSSLVTRARYAAGMFVAPAYHGHISSLHEHDSDHEARIQSLERLEPLVHNLPAFLGHVGSVNNTARLLRREFASARDDTAERLACIEAALASVVDAIESITDANAERGACSPITSDESERVHVDQPGVATSGSARFVEAARRSLSALGSIGNPVSDPAASTKADEAQ
jgi:hypothetical protein